ncbi:HAD family hydrolase [Candidatus Woesearchaeota archaeon]|nr:HAD family hydrolase [Candidatus Woesearchaeota archaeon]MBW3022105.1 HAD family hydrolase [Candidatus Woesearchaeota archaeon]
MAEKPVYLLGDWDDTFHKNNLNYFVQTYLTCLTFGIKINVRNIIRCKTMSNLIKELGIDYDEFHKRFGRFDRRGTPEQAKELYEEGRLRVFNDTYRFFHDLNALQTHFGRRIKLGIISDNHNARNTIEALGLSHKPDAYRAWHPRMPRQWRKPHTPLAKLTLHDMGYFQERGPVILMGDSPNDLLLGRNLEKELDTRVQVIQMRRWGPRYRTADKIVGSLDESIDALYHLITGKL